MNFARRYWKHLLGLHLGAAATGLALFLLVFQAAPQIATVFGQKLDKQGQRLYAIAVRHHTEYGQKTLERETLPPRLAAKVRAANDRLARSTHPHPLATPQPVTFTALVRNYSSRRGTHPLLWVVHDAEMPNAPGLRSLRALAGWFNNPGSQASSNYGTDAWGNTVLMVPTSAKAWHVAWFNSWAIGDELIGYAHQRNWPDAQLRAAALLDARDSVRYGIPLQRAKVQGCRIVRGGTVEHADLGGCGGGHHDPGTNFPIRRFIALARQYANALRHPTPKPKPACTVKQLQRALDATGEHLAVDGVNGPHTRAALRRHPHLHPKGCHA